MAGGHLHAACRGRWRAAGNTAEPAPKLKGLILGRTNMIQTIPSLALFGLLLPVPWLGARADRLAILALTCMHCCPWCATHIPGSPGSARRCAKPPWPWDSRRANCSGKWNCRWPPNVIFAGIRVATVITIGVATIAAAIGAGGLGEFIFRGIAMVDNRVILAGAIPAALMALSRTSCWVGVEKLLARRHR